jgi:hypothetical protein
MGNTGNGSRRNSAPVPCSCRPSWRGESAGPRTWPASTWPASRPESPARDGRKEDTLDKALIIPIIIAAVFTSLCYYRGRKKNRWISAWISREAEAALKPQETQYTNFGGSIGYNFVYKLKKPFREAKGTFTLLPRQSVFYMPISLLISRHDKLYVQLYAEGKLAGEGHILSRSFLPRARAIITGFEGFSRTETDCGGRRFVLLFKDKKMEERLTKLLFNLERPEILVHFCCYGENRNFYLYVKPVREKLGALLRSYVPELGRFFVKGGFADEGGNPEED